MAQMVEPSPSIEGYLTWFTSICTLLVVFKNLISTFQLQDVCVVCVRVYCIGLILSSFSIPDTEPQSQKAEFKRPAVQQSSKERGY